MSVRPQAIAVGESHGGDDEYGGQCADRYQYFVLPEDGDLSDPTIYRVDAEPDTAFVLNVERLSGFLRGLS
ncbi:MAG: hypothetical protein HC919_02065 [Oscillatoriales cyanobacterium SM2_2_1]|nr:hypothetical protein [Oscillatoriales cyanobacterium SM2_2_1]